MSKVVRIKRKTLIAVSIVLALLVVLSFIIKADILFTMVFIIWALLFTLSISNIKESPMLFCFLISFFVFLLGRQFCCHFFNAKPIYQYLDVTNNKTYFYLIISLIGIVLGLLLISWNKKVVIRKTKQSSFLENGKYGRNYSIACLAMFYICYVGMMGALFLQIRFVQNVGYLGSYTEGAGGAGIPSYLSFMAKFAPVALCLYLATKPTKKEAFVPLMLYEIYGIIYVFTGQRYPFIAISMFVLIYYIIRGRDEKNWIMKYHYILLIIAIPILMMLSTVYDSIRVGKEFNFVNYIETLEEFFIQQGGSINVIRRTIYSADKLKDMHLVSFNSTYTVLFENPISRRLFHITTYSGNSVARAMNTNSLAHRLSYLAYGPGYLMGRGTGSSYIAELLHDFGVIGIFVGSLVYGSLLGMIDHIRFNDKLRDGIKLSIIYYLILSPRGSFDAFVNGVFHFYCIIGFALLIILSIALRKKFYYKV